MTAFMMETMGGPVALPLDLFDAFAGLSRSVCPSVMNLSINHKQRWNTALQELKIKAVCMIAIHSSQEAILQKLIKVLVGLTGVTETARFIDVGATCCDSPKACIVASQTKGVTTIKEAFGDIKGLCQSQVTAILMLNFSTKVRMRVSAENAIVAFPVFVLDAFNAQWEGLQQVSIVRVGTQVVTFVQGFHVAVVGVIWHSGK